MLLKNKLINESILFYEDFNFSSFDNKTIWLTQVISVTNNLVVSSKHAADSIVMKMQQQQTH